MEFYFILLIVFISFVYIFLYIRKMLTSGETNPKCANCAFNKINAKPKER